MSRYLEAHDDRGGAQDCKGCCGLAKTIADALSVQNQLNEGFAEVHREMGQISFAVSKALLAHALGCEPTSEEVNTVLSIAITDPSFPFRAYRLLGEARKTASRRRRVFLASFLFGLPFAPLSEDQRDRVDMVVERMTPEDAQLLSSIGDRAGDERSHLFVSFSAANVAILTSNEHRTRTRPQDGFERYSVDPHAFASLISLGCTESREMSMSEVNSTVSSTLHVTAIGNLVLNALNEVKAGMNVDMPETGSIP